jgi:molecular chaperone DnaK
MAVYGIDLGTTDSRIAYVNDAGRPVVLKSMVGEDATPSVVYFESPESVVVGRQAKDHAALVPELVVQWVKRQMGQDVDYSFHGQHHTPETISALILRELARAAQEQTGEEVRDVVITVPAYFGLLEREATRKAGEIAGLNVVDILAEPVAAALAYEALGPGSGVRDVLLYDLGGGTFDTTVIRAEGDNIRVVCTDGDSHLGGADWDRAIADFLLHGFTDQYPQLDPAGDEQFMQDLATSAEQLKKALSATLMRKYSVRFGGRVVRLELSRARLEDLTSELLERTMEITARTVATAREKGVERFDDVLLVGGMTIMPVIARTLKERFGLDARQQDPQLAAARGAALFGVMMNVKMSRPDDGDSSAAAGAVEEVAAHLGISAEQVKRLAAKSVTAVVPRALGLKVVDSADPERARGYISHLLTANTPLPADTGPQIFRTVVDNQREVELEVWEQAGSIASEELEDNSLIGGVVLTNLPPRPAGTAFEVAFHMTETGLLSVRGREAGSGREVRIEIQVGGLDEAETQQAASAVARYERPQLSREELALVRRSAEREARHLDVPESATGELADQMIEVLSEPEAGRRPETTGTVGPASSGAGEPASKRGLPPAGRYLVGRFPDTVRPGKIFSLVVSVIRSVGAPPKGGAPLRQFEVPADGRLLTLIIDAPGLRVLDDHRQVVRVPPGGDSELVKFDLLGDEPGPRRISVTAWDGGSYLGELAVEVSVERDGPERPDRTAISEAREQRTDGEVTLLVRYDSHQTAYRFEFIDVDYPDEVTSQLVYDPGPAVERLIRRLNTMAEGTAGYSAAATRAYLVNEGVTMWQELVPEQLRSQFWERQRRITQLTILTNRDVVPWELLYPKDRRHDAGFLVEQFPVTRAIYGQARQRRLRLHPARFVVPPGSPAEAKAEVEALAGLLSTKLATVSELMPLLGLITQGRFGLLHFACHNRFDPDDGSSIRLDSSFSPTFLATAVSDQTLARAAPVVFINACRSLGKVPSYNKLDGWAEKFLRAGAAAFIGSLWDVSDGMAREFAQELYRRLAAGEPLGSAVMAGRRAVAAEPGDPTWLAYAVYGDPQAKIDPAT